MWSAGFATGLSVAYGEHAFGLVTAVGGLL